MTKIKAKEQKSIKCYYYRETKQIKQSFYVQGLKHQGDSKQIPTSIKVARIKVQAYKGKSASTNIHQADKNGDGMTCSVFHSCQKGSDGESNTLSREV